MGVDTSENFVIRKDTVDILLLMLKNIIPELAIAYIVMKLYDGEWGLFWWVIAAMNGFYILMWAINTMITEISFRLYFRKRFADIAFSEFERLHFPAIMPGIIAIESPENIYAELAYNENYPCDIRIKCAAYSVEYNNLNSSASYLAIKRINQSHRDALTRYSNKYPNYIIKDGSSKYSQEYLS